MTMLRVLALAAALGGVAAPALAQGNRPATTRQQDPRRDSLEARVQARMAIVLRRQVGLNDEQITRLQAVNRRFEGQRRTLFEQERRVRGELRAALAADSAQDARVASLLDRTIQLQRERLDLLEAEQKELATFMSPTQRARLYGMEEQMRRRMQELRDARPSDGQPRRGGPPGGPPGGERPGAARRPPAR
jgi:hypothetical protein